MQGEQHLDLGAGQAVGGVVGRPVPGGLIGETERVKAVETGFVIRSV